MAADSSNSNTKANPNFLVRAVASPKVQNVIVGTRDLYQGAKNRHGSVKTVLTAAESALKTVASFTAPLATPVVDMIGGWDTVDQVRDLIPPPSQDGVCLQRKNKENQTSKETLEEMHSILDAHSSVPNDDRHGNGTEDMHTMAVGLPTKARKILRDSIKSKQNPRRDLEGPSNDNDAQPSPTMELIHLGHRRAGHFYSEVKQEPKMIITWVISLLSLGLIFAIQLCRYLFGSLINLFSSSNVKVFLVSAVDTWACFVMHMLLKLKTMLMCGVEFIWQHLVSKDPCENSEDLSEESPKKTQDVCRNDGNN